MVRPVVVLLCDSAWAVIIWAASLEACEFDETVRNGVLTERGGVAKIMRIFEHVGASLLCQDNAS